jgi:hypothetical protein
MYEGQIFVGGRIAGLGADAVEAEASDDDRALLGRELAPHGIDPDSIPWKKLVAGRRLWNFRKHEYDQWRHAL